MRPFALALAASTALVACSEQASVISNREVGLPAGVAYFGSAVAANQAINNGDESYRVNLAHRFAAEVQSMVNFPFNSTELSEEARAILRQQAAFINQFPEVRFRVYGHTDLVGSTASNNALGLRRAQAVALYLQSQGVGASRLESVVSYGESRPLIATEGMELANRRTVTEVAGFVARHPTVMNGRYAEIIFRDYVASAGIEATIQGISGAELATEN